MRCNDTTPFSSSFVVLLFFSFGLQLSSAKYFFTVNREGPL
jgi:hypothetical protein